MVSDFAKVEALVDALNTEVARDTMPARVKALAAAAKALKTDLVAQQTAADLSQIPRLEQLARSLWMEVELATGTGPRRSFVDRLLEQFSVGAIFGVFILVASLGGVAWLIVAYLDGANVGSLQTIEGTRPLLTIASIIATLAFGGGLVFAALFSNEGSFENRFRLAREIFLVFSGVFATVVGFHFGAPNTLDKSAPAVAIGEVVVQERDGKLLLTIQGGTPPFAAEVRVDGARKTGGEGLSPLEIELAGIDLVKPVDKLEIQLKDAKGKTRSISAAKIALKGFVWPLKEAAAPAALAASGASGARGK